jgi:hypothetical protein
MSSWNVVREETENRAKFHSDLSDGLVNNVANPLKELVRATEKQIKKGRTNAKVLLKDLSATEKLTEEAKSKYEKARKKQYDAKDEYERASFSANTNPKLKEQLAKKVQTEHKSADKLDTGYAEQVSKLQELQVKCYETEVPAILAEFEKLERGRIAAVVAALQAYLDLEQKLPKLAEDSLIKMQNAVTDIDVDSDIQEFIRQSKSGALPPPRAQYHPYDESAGRCLAPQSSISVGFAPGGRVLAAPGSAGVTVVDAMRQVSPRSAGTGRISGAKSSTNLNSSAGTVRKGSPASTPTRPKGIGTCRALYDYDAQSDLELSFKERDVIAILEKDESGWWHGELNGRVGVFPAANWVEEFDPNAPESSATLSARLCVALFDYEAQDDEELTIVEGEILTVESEDSGWYFGKNHRGEHGRWPSNFCEITE